MVRVRIVDVSRVTLSRGCAADLEPVGLSFFDTYWIAVTPIQRLFLYHTQQPFPFIVEELKDSLSRTLPRFYSLAGRFTQAPDSGDLVISFSGDGHDGVDFLEAEAEAEGVEFRRLADDEDHDVECFSSLVPPLNLRKLPAPVFSVQVTGFPVGGVAVGFSMHHMATDGKGVWLFLEAWAAECRRAATGGPEPVLDRSMIRHPAADEIARRFVVELAPNLPSLPDRSLSLPERRQLSRKTFVIDAASIASLRDRGTGATRPSAFVALSAHIWLTLLRAKGVPPDDQPATLAFLADCRRHLDPPVGNHYFGNCVKACFVRVRASELLGDEGGFEAACTTTRRAISDCLRDPLVDCEDWAGMFLGLPVERRALVVASPRFRAYEADFGWGRPRRVELASMNMDGEASLVGARDEEGAVQASVALSPLHMDGFASHFIAGLQQTR